MGQDKNGLYEIIGRLFPRIKNEKTAFSCENQEDLYKNTSGDIDLDESELFDEVAYELPETVEPVIERIYNSLPGTTRDLCFYGDPRNAQIILSRLADILMSGDRAKDLEDAWLIYNVIHTRAKLLTYPSDVIDSICQEYRGKYPAEKLTALLKESLKFIYAHDEELKSDVSSDAYIMLMHSKREAKNIGVEEKYKNDKDYGLTPEKPVFVRGKAGMYLYLDNLCTKKGHPLVYEQFGSRTVEEIKGMVNEFMLYRSEDKTPYGIIYLCINGNDTSHRAPKGMKLSTIGKLQRVKLWCSMVFRKKNARGNCDDCAYMQNDCMCSECRIANEGKNCSNSGNAENDGEKNDSIGEYDWKKIIAEILNSGETGKDTPEEYADERTDGKPNDQERMICADDSVYENEMENPIPDGQKRITLLHGAVYQGKLKYGRPEGMGIMIYAENNKKDRKKYSGEWKNGKPNGQGKIIWKRGPFYEGSVKDGKRSGSGKMIYNSDEVYEGEWKDDSYNGYGKMVFNGGDVYEGEWKNGKPNGKGKSISKSRDSVYEGEWKDGFYNGYGKLTLRNRYVYEGGWKINKHSGYGITQYRDGVQFEGTWKDGERDGKGRWIFPDGSVLEEEFKDGKPLGGHVIR